MRSRRWSASPGRSASPATDAQSPVASADDPGKSLPTLVCFPRVVRRPILDLGWITSDGLARHLAAMKNAGCRFVDLRRFLEPAAVATQPEVVVAFGDEGPAFVELAWPILQRLEVSPVLFLRTARVGRIRRSLLRGAAALPHLTWSELRGLVAEGAAVQSAGHHGLDAARVPAEMLYGDLIRSRREIENRLGDEPLALRYPYDAHGELACDVARQAGFELAFAAGIDPPFEDRLQLGRVPVGTFSKRSSVLRRLRLGAAALQG